MLVNCWVGLAFPKILLVYNPVGDEVGIKRCGFGGGRLGIFDSVNRRSGSWGGGDVVLSCSLGGIRKAYKRLRP